MALILCIETGTDICSVALARDGQTISLRESDAGRDHAAKVGVFVKELLDENSLLMDDIDAVAVGKGPGSYTGLRIGVSFAKGLAYGSSCPLIAVGSLDALAEVAKSDMEAGLTDIEEKGDMLLCPMVDARRMEVYAQIFDASLTPLCAPVAEVICAESFSDVRKGRKMCIFGSGAGKCEGIMPDTAFISVAPSARGMAHLAEEAFNRGEFADVAYLEPFYLKDFVVTASKKKLF